jgi:hypothetical protein
MSHSRGNIELSFFTKLGLAIHFRRKAATPSKAKPSREIVEPPSGTRFVVGRPEGARFAATGWARENAAAAAKASKSLDTVFMSD